MVTRVKTALDRQQIAGSLCSKLWGVVTEGMRRRRKHPRRMNEMDGIEAGGGRSGQSSRCPARHTPSRHDSTQWRRKQSDGLSHDMESHSPSVHTAQAPRERTPSLCAPGRSSSADRRRDVVAETGAHS
ncbi:hypothetical protein BHM03_00012988 [Ensete ventricosum]|nr:hypothetical protein BHM03_00012988 [Ensete ventricosum]